MNGSLRVERIFSLSDYNNIKFSQEITDIPGEVVLGERTGSLLYLLMMLEIEKAHKEYIRLYREFPASVSQIDETMKIIEEAKSRTYMELMAELQKLNNLEKE